MKKFLTSMVIAMVVTVATVVMAAEYKYNAVTTGAGCALTFGPAAAPRVVHTMDTSCDYPLGAVSFYAWSGANATRLAPNSNHVVNTTVIACKNTTGAMTNGDIVVYQHADGTPDKDLVASATTGTVTLTTGITTAGTSGDYLFEVTLAGKMYVAGNGANAGTNTLAETKDCFVVPGGSPLYASMPSSTNACLGIVLE